MKAKPQLASRYVVFCPAEDCCGMLTIHPASSETYWHPTLLRVETEGTCDVCGESFVIEAVPQPE
jgi:hypothetical protein